MLSKLIGLATIGSTLGGTLAHATFLQRWLAGLAMLVVLVIVSAFMGALLLAGGLYGVYYGLTVNGVSETAAILTVVGLAVGVTGGLVALTTMRLRHLRIIPVQASRSGFPGLSQLSEIADAFMEGLSHKSRAKN